MASLLFRGMQADFSSNVCELNKHAFAQHRTEGIHAVPKLNDQLYLHLSVNELGRKFWSATPSRYKAARLCGSPLALFDLGSNAAFAGSKCKGFERIKPTGYVETKSRTTEQ